MSSVIAPVREGSARGSLLVDPDTGQPAGVPGTTGTGIIATMSDVEDDDDQIEVDLPEELTFREPGISSTDALVARLRALQTGAQSRPRRPLRVLSIDGGGIRGVAPARVLEHLESLTGNPLHRSFDLIAGTSTGGIIALGVTAPRSGGGARNNACALRRLYEQAGPDIFPRTARRALIRPWLRARYANGELARQLRTSLGAARLSEALTHVLVPSWDAAAARPVLFDSKRAKHGGDQDVDMIDAALATSAAPTYFPAHGEMLDGGVVANNPLLLAYTVVRRLHPSRRLVMLSLGTGRGAVPHRPRRAQGRLGWAPRLPGLLIDAPNEQLMDTVRLIERLEGARTSPTGRRALTVLRLQPDIATADARLDEAEPANIRRLIAAADALVSERGPDLRKFAAML